MFVRKKKNKSGIVSIQVIDKSTGNYRVIKTIGSSKDTEEINQLYSQGREYIKTYQGQRTFTFQDQDFTQTVKNSISGINIEGVHLLLGKIYSEIGFDGLNSELLKQLVLLRLSHPASKLKTSQYLRRYFSTDISEDRIYRYLDLLYKE